MGILRELLTTVGLNILSLLGALNDEVPETTYHVKDTKSLHLLKKVGTSMLRAFRPKEVAAKTDCDYYPKELPEQYLANVLMILYRFSILVVLCSTQKNHRGRERQQAEVLNQQSAIARG